MEHHIGEATYEAKADVVQMPFPETFRQCREDYYAAKLHEMYHATSHKTREFRRENKKENPQNDTLEEMQAEMFSLLAGARFNLPMPNGNSATDSARWNQKFSGEEAKGVLQIVAEAAKILTTMNQFRQGEQPKRLGFQVENFGIGTHVHAGATRCHGVHLHEPAPLATPA